MKTAVLLSVSALAIIWIRRRRYLRDDHRALVVAAGKIGGWIEEEWPG